MLSISSTRRPLFLGIWNVCLVVLVLATSANLLNAFEIKLKNVKGQVFTEFTSFHQAENGASGVVDKQTPPEGFVFSRFV